MTQPDPSDRLTPGARTLAEDIEVALSGGPRPEPRVIDLHAKCRDGAAQAAAQTAAAVKECDELLEALGWFVGPEASNYFRDIPMDLVLKAKARYAQALSNSEEQERG